MINPSFPIFDRQTEEAIILINKLQYIYDVWREKIGEWCVLINKHRTIF